jgi:hypothetical protein
MIVAYLTTDEVNQCLAAQLAQECGATLCPLWPHEALQTELFDAVVYDWDYLPSERQQEVLAELLSGSVPRPVAVHGYNLDESQAAALCKHQVAVYRYLQPEVFQLLHRAVVQSQGADLVCRDPCDNQDGEQELLHQLPKLFQGSERRMPSREA